MRFSRHVSLDSLKTVKSMNNEDQCFLTQISQQLGHLESGCDKILKNIYSNLDHDSLKTVKSMNNEDQCFLTQISQQLGHLESGCDKILKNIYSNLDHVEPDVASGWLALDSVEAHSRTLDPAAREILAHRILDLFVRIFLPEPPQYVHDVDARLIENILLVPEKLIPCEYLRQHYKHQLNRKKDLLLPIDKIYPSVKTLKGTSNSAVCNYVIRVVQYIIENFLKDAIRYEDTLRTTGLINASTLERIFSLYQFQLKPRKFVAAQIIDLPTDYYKCYDELTRFLQSSLEDLNILLRVFRLPMTTTSDDTDNGDDQLSSNLLEVYNTYRLLVDMLDQQDDDGQDLDGTGSFKEPSLAGSCLLELAEVDCLHVASKYAAIVLTPSSHCRDQLWANLASSGTLINELCDLSESIVKTTTTAPCCYRPSTTDTTTKLKAASYSSDPRFLSPVCSLLQPSTQNNSPVKPSPLPSSSRRRSASTNTIIHPSPSVFHSGMATLGNQKVNVEENGFSSPGNESPCWTNRLMVSPTGAAAGTDNYLVNAARYLLPRLLLIPVVQFYYFFQLVEALHRSAFDVEDRARLAEVLSILRRTRTSLDYHLSRNFWVGQLIDRLVACGQLATAYRSICSSLFSSSSTSHPGDTTSSSGVSPPLRTGRLSDSSATSSCKQSPQHRHDTSNTSSSSVFTFDQHNNALVTSPPLTGRNHSGDDLDLLLERFILPSGFDRSCLGSFVQEGRVQLRSDSKRHSTTTTDYLGFLFTNHLLLTKLVDRSSQTPIKVKHLIAIDSIQQLIDYPPLNQPLFEATTTTSSSSPSAVSLSRTTSQSLSQYNELISVANGSMLSQISLASTYCPSNINIDDNLFKLEYVDQTRRDLHRSWSSAGSNCPPPSPPPLPPKGIAPCSSPSHYGNSHCCHQHSTAGPSSRQQQSLLTLWIGTRTPEEKADWMASLLALQIYPLFLRYVRTLPKIEVPLRLPSPAVYRFACPDQPENIRFQPARRHGDTNCCDTLQSSDVDYSSCDELLASDCEDAIQHKRSESGGTTTTTLLHPTRPNRCSLPCIVAVDNRAHNKPYSSIIASQHKTSSTHLIQSATLVKLIEHMTLPSSSFDSRLVNMFLLVFRRFTTPEHLVELLIERYRVPDPEFRPDELVTTTTNDNRESPAQIMLKRFRSVYKRRVQSRVITFLSRWVRSTRYFPVDFFPNPRLCNSLIDFLNTVQSRHLQPSIGRLRHCLTLPSYTLPVYTTTTTTLSYPAGSSCSSSTSSSPSAKSNDTLVPSDLAANDQMGDSTAPTPPPPATPLLSAGTALVTIHPFILAEQITLYEWELYHAVQFWEIEGRQRHNNNTPNLNRSKNFSNRLRNWLVFAVMSFAHPDDRVIAIQRLLDLLQVMELKNNMQGQVEVQSVLLSASVFRLHKTFNTIRRNKYYKEIVDQVIRAAGNTSTSKSSTNRLTGSKGHQGDLRRLTDLNIGKASRADTSSSNQPGVPFFASKLITRLIHLEETYPDVLPVSSNNTSNDEMINCWKHYRLASVVEDYLAYQRIAYDIEINHEVRAIIESMDLYSLAGVSNDMEFEAKMYELSACYEPRESDSSAQVQSTPPSPCASISSSETRQIGREAIQAAQLLANCSFKDRISSNCMLAYASALGQDMIPRERSYTPFPRPTSSTSSQEGGYQHQYSASDSSITSPSSRHSSLSRQPILPRRRRQRISPSTSNDFHLLPPPLPPRRRKNGQQVSSRSSLPITKKA